MSQSKGKFCQKTTQSKGNFTAIHPKVWVVKPYRHHVTLHLS